MDLFSEQLIKIRKTTKDFVLLGLLWSATFILIYIVVLISFKNQSIMGFLFLLIVGIFYGALTLAKKLSVEYEYIVVNNDFDIDKITAKSNRKRLISIKINNIDDMGDYDVSAAQKLSTKRFDLKLFCCNPEDEKTYIIYKHPKKGTVLLVVAMNKKTKNEFLKSIPVAIKRGLM